MSKIDFEALKEKFEKGRKPIEVQKLRGQIAQKLVQMVRLNRTRMNFLEEFQKMIDEYNAGASNLETLFDRLMAFTKRLSEEEKRGIAEQLTEEELAIFDLLTKPNMKLTKAEEIEVKKVAKELLETLKKEKLVLDWKKRQTTGRRCDTRWKRSSITCQGYTHRRFMSRSASRCTSTFSILMRGRPAVFMLTDSG